MSANTTIKEGGKGYHFGPVKCLMVEGDNGEFYPWYPEADRALDSLSVTQNGIYRASDRGVYGWNHVSVNVAQSDRVTGRDPETGQEVTVTVDPETGELVETVVPVEIRVIAPPTNPYGTYQNGQTIANDGMVVKSYLQTGGEYGTVPNGEITLDPTTAVYDPSTETGMSGDATLDGVTYPITGEYIGEYEPQGAAGAAVVGFSSGTGIGSVFYDSLGHLISVIAGSSPTFTYEIIALHWGPNIEPYYIRNSITVTNVQSYTRDGKTVYFILPSVADGSAPVVERYTNINTTAWALIYGDVHIIPAGSRQQIAVSWPRPGDGAILETTFDILVGPRGGQGDE